MTKQFDHFFDGVELTRKWSTLALANFEQFASLNLDQAEAFFDRSSEQLKASLVSAGSVQEPVQWSEIVLASLRRANDNARDTILGASKYQIESLRILQEQAEEVQKLLAASFAQQFAHIESVNSGNKPGSSTTAAARKLAA